MRSNRAILAIFFISVITLIFSLNASAQQDQIIPYWIKASVAFWVEGQISDQEFINIIQYFVERDIIKIPDTTDTRNSELIQNLQIFQSEINEKVRFLQALSNNPQLQQVLIDSNEKFSNIKDVDTLIDQRDEEWIATQPNKITPFMTDLINNQGGLLMQTIIQKDKEENRLFTFEEIFATNSFGANAAQSGKTSDYRQNDEEWWKQAKQHGLYLEDGKFDESTGVYASNIAVKIVDGKGNFLGVMKGVINVEELITP